MYYENDLVEHAIYVATLAHCGQKRKVENSSMIYHPMTVGYMLDAVGCSKPVTAGGILHDVPEDTKYTFKDVYASFGDEVGLYVYQVSEHDKSLEWEVRKYQLIEQILYGEQGSKLIEICDRTHNLENLYDNLGRYGEAAWNKFHRGKELQKWFYCKMYESCVKDLKLKFTDPRYELVLRYKNILKKLFNITY